MLLEGGREATAAGEDVEICPRREFSSESRANPTEFMELSLKDVNA